ncbi:MAG: polysaccharide biosynthesis C-terminal domain-containing protein, partial [Alphaproteobacteria bacterium]|nr:polysaccharide biosynthesis C-terminal domain-containing protein [Alphaproteobacteria bacterium]
GSISYLYYGDRLNQLPLGIVGVAVGTALLPMLSRAVAAGHEVEAKHLFNRALEVCLVLALPAGIALVTAAEPIISVLFERGEFTAADTKPTSYVLMGYALGLPAYVAVKVLSGAFWARQDTMSPVRVGIKAAVVNILLAIVLSRFIGVAGIALATGIAGWVQFTLLFRGLRGQTAVQIDDRLRWVFPRILLAAAIMAAYVIGVQFVLADWFDSDSGLKRLLALAALVGGGGLIYGAGVTLSGALTLADLKKYFKRKELAQDVASVTNEQ